jgi:hypothetical protein
MVYAGGGTPPSFDPHDAKALQRAAEQDAHNNLGLTQDLAIISGWLWRPLIWPIRLLIRAIRR